MATELRSLSFGDWATANSVVSLSTSTGIFTRDDTADDNVPFVTFLQAGDSLRIEELYSSAGYTNEFRIELGNTLIITSKPNSDSEGVYVKSDSSHESLDKLVFKTNTARPSDTTAAGDVFLFDNDNLRTYVLVDGQTTHLIWALEDIHNGAERNDYDFNDYLFYAQLSAVPELSAVITVGFLGLTVFRRRFVKNHRRSGTPARSSWSGFATGWSTSEIGGWGCSDRPAR